MFVRNDDSSPPKPPLRIPVKIPLTRDNSNGGSSASDGTALCICHQFLMQVQIASKFPRLLFNLMLLRVANIIQHTNDNLSPEMMMMAAPKSSLWEQHFQLTIHCPTNCSSPDDSIIIHNNVLIHPHQIMSPQNNG